MSWKLKFNQTAKMFKKEWEVKGIETETTCKNWVLKWRSLIKGILGVDYCHPRPHDMNALCSIV